ncbi:phosphate/sulfate permease [Trueperella abortisuis]|uniref:Phosphate/sulfate permease n=1 Tax=Trueperella abortisuis TaxID=445930 RepID=A0ABT9PIM4_9ACTO|nr:phosphate/sulfate permease [Trueperella abortisuis]
MSANSGVYWLLVMTGFFAYSFITEDWGQSWIIWPVAGVLFAALMVGLSYWVGSRQENRQDA